jgi:hypothetical protein
MHDCQRFREEWIAGLTEDAGGCEPCLSFCEDSRLILQSIDGASQPIPELSEKYWDQFDGRLRSGLANENAWRRYRFYGKTSMAAAAASIVLVFTWAAIRPSQPIGENAKVTPEIEFVEDHITELNPTVVTFLGQSELFLRSFTKIDPSYEDDLQDARSRAKQDLAEIKTQQLRAADFSPVRMTLDEYESVLREIKNVDSAAQIADIQARIRRSGLIASMTAYQPHVMMVVGGRHR